MPSIIGGKEVGTVNLYNTLTRRVDAFAPDDGKTVGMYVCGPTVYDHLHIGNLRPIIVFDALRRYFQRFKGWNVVYVQNVTDVDDKLIARSLETGESVESIAKQYTAAYFRLLDDIRSLPPTHSPLATEHIADMIDLVQTLVRNKAAYESDGDVYFRVAASRGYGKLSGRSLDEQEAGARVATLDAKENPLDFTLWKAAKPGEPSWPSPWGDGRPGWHTECVVLSRRYLGEHLDIHAGGNDLIFPHHENEIAQAEAASEQPFFRFWLHNGMLSFDGEKMSKSLGNFAYAKDVLATYGAEVVRYFYLSRHYRKPLEFAEDGLVSAQTALSRLTTLVSDIDAELRTAPDGQPGEEGRRFRDTLASYRARYIEAMDDLNTVGAIGALQELASAANRFRNTTMGSDRLVLRDVVALLRELCYPLAVLPDPSSQPAESIEGELLGLLTDLRVALRKKKEFELADLVRDRLAACGITLKDTPQGTLWTRQT
jgi:cysteinyl-tRNA synthetase